MDAAKELPSNEYVRSQDFARNWRGIRTAQFGGIGVVFAALFGALFALVRRNRFKGVRQHDICALDSLIRSSFFVDSPKQAYTTLHCAELHWQLRDTNSALPLAHLWCLGVHYRPALLNHSTSLLRKALWRPRDIESHTQTFESICVVVQTHTLDENFGWNRPAKHILN